MDQRDPGLAQALLQGFGADGLPGAATGNSQRLPGLVAMVRLGRAAMYVEQEGGERFGDRGRRVAEAEGNLAAAIDGVIDGDPADAAGGASSRTSMAATRSSSGSSVPGEGAAEQVSRWCWLIDIGLAVPQVPQ